MLEGCFCPTRNTLKIKCVRSLLPLMRILKIKLSAIYHNGHNVLQFCKDKTIVCQIEIHIERSDKIMTTSLQARILF